MKKNLFHFSNYQMMFIYLFFGFSAIQLAAKKDNFEIVELLLKEIKIIDSECFKNCTQLSQLSIPSSICIIDQHAFEFCLSLSQISILSPTIVIKKFAFSGCSS